MKAEHSEFFKYIFKQFILLIPIFLMLCGFSYLGLNVDKYQFSIRISLEAWFSDFKVITFLPYFANNVKLDLGSAKISIDLV